MVVKNEKLDLKMKNEKKYFKLDVKGLKRTHCGSLLIGEKLSKKIQKFKIFKKFNGHKKFEFYQSMNQ